MDNLQNVRLECLKLASNRAHGPDEVVGQAKKFEAYVVGPQEPAKVEPKIVLKETKSRPGKKEKSDKLESLL